MSTNEDLVPLNADDMDVDELDIADLEDAAGGAAGDQMVDDGGCIINFCGTNLAA